MKCSVNFLDNQKEYYEPGQKLKAEVVLNLTKTEKINKLSCQILGYAKCRWNEEKGSATPGNVVTNYGHESYIKENFDLLENYCENLTELKPGQHKFKVSYVLSSNLPSSFKCDYGSIKYKIIVIIDRPWKLKTAFEFPFTVIHPRNLNREGNLLRNQVKDEISKTFKMGFTTDPLLVSASIPFSAYVPGQVINLDIDVKNLSNTHVKAMKISLIKIVCLNSTKPKRRTKQIALSEVKISTESVPVQTSKIFKEMLLVPSLTPNISNCEVIQVSYELRVKAMTSGFSRSPKLKLPITIGTSPLNWPDTQTCRISLPPSYEESQRVYQNSRRCSENSIGENSFEENDYTPRYPDLISDEFYVEENFNQL